jgi:hypothetical protein
MSNIQDAFVTDPVSVVLMGAISAVFGEYITAWMDKAFACIIDKEQ